VSHGCWRWPTQWGKWFRDFGFCWVYVPHGMLEPWSMQQKSWKKRPYFHFFEKPRAVLANAVRAVGAPEAQNLTKQFSNVVLIPNGVAGKDHIPQKEERPLIFLFMARLHVKKGPLNLIKAWKNTNLNNSPDYELIMAGPDEGELAKIQTEMEGSSNISYVGAIYGSEKKKLLERAYFYVLPSLSEGFPTSVVEAMMNGLIPLLSSGCNFPEIFEKHLGIETGTSVASIQNALLKAIELKGEWSNFRQRGFTLVNKKYGIDTIANLQYDCFSQILNKK